MERTFVVHSMSGGLDKKINIDPEQYIPPMSPGTIKCGIPGIAGGCGKSKSNPIIEDCFGQYRAPVTDCIDCPVNFQCGAIMISKGNTKMGVEVPFEPRRDVPK